MELDKQQAEKLRARLANRTSFFGGSMSTRNASASTSYIPPAELPPPMPKPGKGMPSARAAAKAGQAVSARPAQPAQPPKDPLTKEAEKLRRMRASFDDVDKDTPKSVPEERRNAPASTSGRTAAQPTGTASRHERGSRADLVARAQGQRAGSAPPQGAASRDQSTPPMRTLTPPPKGVHGRTPPPPNQRLTSSAGPLSRPTQAMRAPAGLQRVKQGKSSPASRSKKGAAGRAESFSPQAVAPTRSQKANLAWKEQMARLRNDAAPSAAAARPSNPAALPISGRPVTQGKDAAGLPRTQNASGHANGSVARDRQAGPSGQSHNVAPGGVRGKVALPVQRAQPSAPMPAALDLRGKDISGLPKWQQDLLHKKWRKRKRREEDSEADDDGFVVDDEDEDWRAAIRQVTGYDPSRFKDERFDDRSMEADWKSIQAEERRSARLGRTEDEKAEQEEIARQACKAAKRKAKRNSQTVVMQ